MGKWEFYDNFNGSGVLGGSSVEYVRPTVLLSEQLEALLGPQSIDAWNAAPSVMRQDGNLLITKGSQEQVVFDGLTLAQMSDSNYVRDYDQALNNLDEDTDFSEVFIEAVLDTLNSQVIDLRGSHFSLKASDLNVGSVDPLIGSSDSGFGLTFLTSSPGTWFFFGDIVDPTLGLLGDPGDLSSHTLETEGFLCVMIQSLNSSIGTFHGVSFAAMASYFSKSGHLPTEVGNLGLVDYVSPLDNLQSSVDPQLLGLFGEFAELQRESFAGHHSWFGHRVFEVYCNDPNFDSVELGIHDQVITNRTFASGGSSIQLFVGELGSFLSPLAASPDRTYLWNSSQINLSNLEIPPTPRDGGFLRRFNGVHYPGACGIYTTSRSFAAGVNRDYHVSKIDGSGDFKAGGSTSGWGIGPILAQGGRKLGLGDFYSLITLSLRVAGAIK